MIGQRIKELRNQNNLTQEALSEGIISRTYLSLIEKGSVEPSNNVLIRLSERLGVSVSDLMEEASSSYHDPLNIRREILFNENKLSRGDTKNVIRFIEESESFIHNLDFLDQGRMFLIYARYFYIKEDFKEAIKYVDLSYSKLKEVMLSTYFVDASLLYAELFMRDETYDKALDLLEPLVFEIYDDRSFIIQTRDLLEQILTVYFYMEEYFTVSRIMKLLKIHSNKFNLLIEESVTEKALVAMYELRNFDTLKIELKNYKNAVSNLLGSYINLNEGDLRTANEQFKSLDANDYQDNHFEKIYKELKERLGSL
ncbi:helix-turn-helix domain-containing protein [Phocicoccus pinnipedialis]|uniref:Anaerobic benzoate catabolism transcriptional regulator n=1 Tax=Phocicoccus pinnipedialis TaxID=110845 RepID=A0A6V7QZQ1_9BACL|nr:helix-turn-helix transcriptional regulator [Jeotgalicoccus pinnipedialis]MBP1938702.1 transcriptional regulator with XRE-family HTH domain [Jeotgalicoccus pinnipedialis]CAD2070477.1 anaerobic benzoate catabolism transcriptional regulator [Jeotgalicoccus pinnipedialis]